MDGEDHPDYHEFLRVKGINHITMVIPSNKRNLSMTQEILKNVLVTAMDTNNYPLLIHCNKGKHRTGCVVGSLRKVFSHSGHSMDDILKEYYTYAGKNARAHDTELLKQFDATMLHESSRQRTGIEFTIDSRHASGWVPVVDPCPKAHSRLLKV